MLFNNIIHPKTYFREDSQTLEEPVTLEELKEQCRITHNDEDDYLTLIITVAREAVEQATNLSLIESDWVGIYEVDSCGALWIPGGKIVSVEYQGEQLPIKRRAGGALTDSPKAGEIEINFRAGHCSSLAKMTVLLWASHLYENRAPVLEASSNEVPLMLRDFISRLRIINV